MRIVALLKIFYNQICTTPRMQSSDWSYDDYWAAKRGENLGRANEFQKARARWIAGRIQDGDRVLDVGCGDGAVLFQLKELVEIRAVGADISNSAVAFLNERGIEAHKVDINGVEGIDGLPCADHVLLLEVLEHMPNPEEFLKRISSKASKSIIFSFPNTGFLPYRLRLLFGRFPVQWRVNPGEHLRFWTYKDLQWWLAELGLKNRCEVGVYEGLPILNKVFPSLFSAGLIAKINLI